MAAPLNIPIPPLTEDLRIEDWQPLFIAATSSLVANSSEKAAIQILPSFICRSEYEQSTVLEAIKETTLKDAFTLLCESLDPPIDQFEAMTRYRKMQWARGVRIEVFFDRLRKQARRAGHSNLDACTALVGELPEEVQPPIKTWVKGREACTEKEAREFATLVQSTLRQKGLALDYGARIKEGTAIRKTDMMPKQHADSDSEEGDTSVQPEVCRIRSAPKSFQSQSSGGYRATKTKFACYTCGRPGHGWRVCPDRVCEKCHARGHDAHQCKVGRSQKGSTNETRRVYVVDYENRWDEESATISVKIAGSTCRALLDTGAKVNVMDENTMIELGLENQLVSTGGQVYGVCCTPVTVKGYVEVSIKIAGEKDRMDRIQVLSGEEQALLLGRKFMQKFGRIAFDWEAGVVELGRAKVPIYAKATGGNPLERARTVKLVSDEDESSLQGETW